MAQKILLGSVIAACLWGVLNPKIKTRTVGTLALSLIALMAMVHLC